MAISPIVDKLSANTSAAACAATGRTGGGSHTPVASRYNSSSAKQLCSLAIPPIRSGGGTRSAAPNPSSCLGRSPGRVAEGETEVREVTSLHDAVIATLETGEPPRVGG